jgi:Spy/CpxP family protein refolding chaperone
MDVRKEESPKVSDIRRKARERLQSVLTPEQWHQLQEKMRSGRINQSSERSSLLPDDWRAQ